MLGSIFNDVIGPVMPRLPVRHCAAALPSPHRRD